MATAARLRVPCDPDAKCEPGEHKHRCECGACWKHDADDFDSTEEFDVAHECPTCGREVRRKFFASDSDMKACLLDFLQMIFDDKF